MYTNTYKTIILTSLFYFVSACDPGETRSNADLVEMMDAGTMSDTMTGTEAGIQTAGMSAGTNAGANAGTDAGTNAGTDAGTQAGTEMTQCDPAPRRLRRLSHREYTNTLKDLLDIDLASIASLVADPKRGGFDQDPHLLEVSPLLADNYQAVAESVSELLIQNNHPWLQDDCSTADEHGSCIYAWILTVGDQVFRRPMTIAEADTYFTLYQTIVADSCPSDGMKWVIIALLQSPHFIYRTELGTGLANTYEFALNAFERANILSYLLWQSMPDAELLAKAQDQSLMQDDVLQAEIQRMLADPKHQRTLNSFLDQWLGLQQIIEVTRDPIVYEALYFELREMMLNETRLFFKNLWEDGSSVSSLFTDQSTWLNQSLATYYQVEDAWENSVQERLVDSQLTDQPNQESYRLTALDQNRPGGLLTQGSLLTIYAHATSSSPIHRGIFVRDRLLCETLPPPPENLDIELPEHQENQDTRTRFQEHSNNAACAGCHELIDPLGFIFESYDGIGRWRAEDEGFPINDDGALIQQDRSSIELSGIEELAQHLSQADQVKRCYVRQWMRFAQGEAEEIIPFGYESDPLSCQIDSIVTQSFTLGDQLSSPLQALAMALVGTNRLGGMEDLETDANQVSLTVPNVEARVMQTSLALDQLTASSDCASGPVNMGGEYRDLTEGLELSLREDRWNAGVCLYYTLSNPTETDIEWSVSLSIEGQVTSGWNCVRDGDSGLISVQGVEWNRIISAGAQFEFGLCTAL